MTDAKMTIKVVGRGLKIDPSLVPPTKEEMIAIVERKIAETTDEDKLRILRLHLEDMKGTD